MRTVVKDILVLFALKFLLISDGNVLDVESTGSATMIHKKFPINHFGTARRKFTAGSPGL